MASGDKRSRLPDALDALLRMPALIPKALAARLKVAPQTGTALLRAAGEGGGPGGHGAGEFPRLRDLRTRTAGGCVRIAIPPRPRRSDRVAVSHVTLVRRVGHPS